MVSLNIISINYAHEPTDNVVPAAPTGQIYILLPGLTLDAVKFTLPDVSNNSVDTDVVIVCP
jgi:hypothetical protein